MSKLINKAIVIFLIISFLTSCASNQKRVSSGEIVNQTATNAIIDVLKNTKPDPFTIIWGSLGLIGALCGIAGGKNTSNEWNRFLAYYGGYEDKEEPIIFDYFVDYDYIIKIDDDSLTW